MPSCKILSKSAKRFLRYRDFSIFKMATVCHLGFSFFLIFGSPSGGGLICIVVPNFGHPLVSGGPMFISVQNFIKIGQTVAEI